MHFYVYTLQYAPWNQSEVLITSTDSRIRLYNGEEMIQKFRGMYVYMFPGAHYGQQVKFCQRKSLPTLFILLD